MIVRNDEQRILNGLLLLSACPLLFQGRTRVCQKHEEWEHLPLGDIQGYFPIKEGIQKVDEMSEGVKGKLIGGKIIFDPTFLNFYLPIYTPTRNIEFTVKVFEAKPNEAEA